MNYEAVIFDLDGTLLDSLADLAASGNRVLQLLGLPSHPLESYRYFVGKGVAVLVERMLPPEERSPAAMGRAVELFKEDYGAHWDVVTAPYPGIEAMLETLVELGVGLSILSNKPDAFVQRCVSKLLPGYRFYPRYGHRQGVARKPDPVGAIEIIEQLQLPREKVLYVGDSGVDMATARGAGLASVGVLWGFREAAELKAAGASYLIGDPAELITIVQGS
ncbi:HAD family hydrolase [Desulfogranum mediterraneum]|uniref:HAD family hydrolase n=1 Tax=Desulfogranum mediterraneum TaxID=160661 RepID=UPI000400C88F|nr:HAD family hydrolase [Desulfogranum mediterraneum]